MPFKLTPWLNIDIQSVRILIQTNTNANRSSLRNNYIKQYNFI